MACKQEKRAAIHDCAQKADCVMHPTTDDGWAEHDVMSASLHARVRTQHNKRIILTDWWFYALGLLESPQQFRLVYAPG